MITGQIIQTSIDELKAITKVDLGVYDLNGSEVASTMERDDITTDLITGFAASPADSQVIGVHHLLKIRDEGELFICAGCPRNDGRCVYGRQDCRQPDSESRHCL